MRGGEKEGHSEAGGPRHGEPRAVALSLDGRRTLFDRVSSTSLSALVLSLAARSPRIGVVAAQRTVAFESLQKRPTIFLLVSCFYGKTWKQSIALNILASWMPQLK